MIKIRNYKFGLLETSEDRYTRDLIISPTSVKPNWWRKEGHRLSVEDLGALKEEDFEVLVIGTGYYGVMKVDNDVLKAMRERGVDVIVAKTGEAVEIFNKLQDEGRKVVGAFHLTC